ncbi:MAG: hypothetical protein IID54_07685, partial [Proteobacteria bacterium]|nr:hypothetical protein [Pseudomonadota bacterium]
RPEEVGLSPWDFTKRFGSHSPGGDLGELDETDGVEVDRESRWEVSGHLEVNCLACHNTSIHQDQSEWAAQIDNENFQWAATAASGMAFVPGAAKDLPIWHDIYSGPYLDYEDIEAPSVHYNESIFARDGKVVFEVTGRPDDERCLFCHSTSLTGHGSPEKWQTDIDIHITAGMQCVDCHRNGLDHMITRGYEGEAEEREDPSIATLSCTGCHLGAEGGVGPLQGGRFAAPKPLHKGMPPVHFEKMSCTSCHSGAWPGDTAQQARISRIHRLGVHGPGGVESNFPHVATPVFMRGEDGKIAPHNVLWPSFWGYREAGGDEVTPIPGEDVLEMAGESLLAKEQVITLLTVLGATEDLTNLSTFVIADPPVYVLKDRNYRLGGSGLIETVEDAPVNFPTPLWCRAVGEDRKELEPFVPEFTSLTVAESLSPSEDLSDAVIFSILDGLYQGFDIMGMPVYIRGKTIYSIPDGDLIQADYDAGDDGAAPYWADDVDDEISKLSDEILTVTIEEMIQINSEDIQTRITAALAALTASKLIDGEPVYAHEGKLYRWQDDEEQPLLIEDDPRADGAPDMVLGGLGDDGIGPLLDEYLGEALADTLGPEFSLTLDQVQHALAQIAEAGGEAQPVYISGELLYELNDSGELKSGDHPAAAPYSWPIAHDVRPAAQSLGANGCRECHSAGAPFFDATVAAASPVKPAVTLKKKMV